MAMEIVDCPINSMVIFNSYVKLPEGMSDNVVISQNRYPQKMTWGGWVSPFCRAKSGFWGPRALIRNLPQIPK